MADSGAGPCRMADTKAGCWGRIASVGLFAAVLFVGISMLSITWGQPRGRAFLVGDRLPGMVSLASAGKRCEDYPWLMYKEAVYSNLNNGGPDSGQGEGMVIKALDMGGNDPQRYGKWTYIVLNATNKDYKAANPPGNGLVGRFGAFNLPGSGRMDFRMSFRDEDKKNLTMKNFALTFFDLDTGAKKTLVESVSVSGYSKYITTDETELKVTTEKDNMTKFEATTEGDAKDNPYNPMAMTNLQKNRAVTFLFEDVTEIFGSTAATAGSGARLFEFVSKNTLACARTVPVTPQMPLADLPFKPPLEKPVAVDEDATFIAWFSNTGDKVKKGHTLATVNVDGKLKEVKAPDDGTITGTQRLTKGDLIGERLILLNIVVIKLDSLAPLRTSAETKSAATVSDDRYFEKYFVKVGDNVDAGDVVATTTLFDGTNKTEVLASMSGGVVAQQPLSPGDPCAKVEDGVLVAVGKFAPLKAGGETPERVISGAVFSKWDVEVGDNVTVGDTVAQIETGSGIIKKTAAYSGKVVQRQDLKKGDVLEDVMPDELFALIKTDGKLRGVLAQGGEQVVKVPKQGLEFTRWEANVSGIVKKGDVIAVLGSTTVKAEKDGILTSRAEGLQPGDKLDEVMANSNLATIGSKLRPLVYKEGMTPSLAEGDGLEFVEWVKNVGEPVNFSDLIAILKGADDKKVNVTAGVKGVIAAEQDLEPGDKIDDFIEESPIMGGLNGKVLALVDLQLPKMQAGPTEKASSYKYGMEFDQWKKELGDKVSKGDVIATVSKNDVSIDLKSETSGFITAIQDGLIKGTVLTEDPGTIATVHDKLRPLKVLYAEKGHDADEDATFSKYFVEMGQKVSMDQELFEVTNPDGEKSAVKAQRSGIVVARQEPLENGDKIKEVLDIRTLVVVGQKLRSLKVEYGEKAATCREGRVFKEWNKTKGDKVEKGDVIARVAKVSPAAGKVGDSGNASNATDANATEKTATDATEVEEEVEDVKAESTGTIVEYQEALKEGMVIDDVMQDQTLVVIGEALRSLHPRNEGTVVYAPAGCTFVKWHIKKGDPVKKRDFVATLKAETGEEFKVQTPESGVIKVRQNLKEGDVIDDLCEDTSLIVVGKLPKLLINEGMAAATAEGEFKEWKVETGAIVKKGDPIAVVTHDDGTSETIKAPKDGPVVRRQDELVPGSRLGTVLEASDLCVIGRFVALEPGMTEEAIEAPRQAIFKEWKKDIGNDVKEGDVIAEVLKPKTLSVANFTGKERRLAASIDGPIEWQTETIKAPTWGSISAEQPLKPGMTIGHQQLGPSIATLDKGVPWWSWGLGLLALLLCCLFCLLFFLCCMRKPAPAPVSDEAKSEPLLKEEAAGLDFHNGSEIITVFPEWRPLGIKHNNVAPVVVNEFTVNSYAKNKLPIQIGWKLVAVGGEQLNDSTDFKEVSKKLGDYMQDLPLWPLPLDFRLKTGEVKRFEFTQRPIGIEFERKSPIRVSAVALDSPANLQGVQTGWQVIKIGDEDTDGKRPYKEVLNIFKEGVTAVDKTDNSQRALAGQNAILDFTG